MKRPVHGQRDAREEEQSGAAGWIRTTDHRVNSPALYPLSYGGTETTHNPAAMVKGRRQPARLLKILPNTSRPINNS